MKYVAAADRYERMTYRACGNSGLKLPGISLGLWHNFGGVDSFEKGREIVLKAFDLGITHLIWPIITDRRQVLQKDHGKDTEKGSQGLSR